MTEQVFGLTAAGIARTAETNRRVLGELPDTGRRTRRVFPQGGGGGTTEIVKFSILSACPGLTGDSSADSCNCVQAVITRVVCGSSLNVGDFITVWDIDTCWLNVPLDLLLSRSGTAILMENNVLDGSAPNCTGYGELRPEACFWNVESLCCSEEVYASA